MGGVPDSTQEAQGLLKAALVVMQRAALPAAASATRVIGDVQARSWVCCVPESVAMPNRAIKWTKGMDG